MSKYINQKRTIILEFFEMIYLDFTLHLYPPPPLQPDIVTITVPAPTPSSTIVETNAGSHNITPQRATRFTNVINKNEST
jgi:hypothetical protein